jgi:hypothetical protein
VIVEMNTVVIEETVALAKKIARAFRKKNQDTLNIINRYIPSNSSASEGIELNLSTEEDRMFARAMILIKDIYQEIHKESLENEYAVIGARHLLMPERKFQNTLIEHDYNIHELEKEYPFVSIKMIAQHIADIEECSVCFRTIRRYHGINRHQSLIRDNADFITRNRIADKALASPDGTYEERIGNFVRGRGWKIDNNEVLIIIFGEN